MGHLVLLTARSVKAQVTRTSTHRAAQNIAGLVSPSAFVISRQLKPMRDQRREVPLSGPDFEEAAPGSSPACVRPRDPEMCVRTGEIPRTEIRPIPNPSAEEVLIPVKASGSAAPSCSPDRAIHPTYGFDACSVSTRSAWLRRPTSEDFRVATP
jgi:hypothetical protein